MLVTVADGRATEVRGDPGAPVHPGRPVRQGQQLRRQGLQPRPAAPSPAARRAQGQRALRAHLLGRRARRDRRPVPRVHRRARPESIMPVSYLGTEGILNGLNVGDAFFNKLGATISERTYCDSGSMHRLLDDDRRHGGRRPGEPGALPLHRHLGLQHDLDEPAPVAGRGRGAAARREGRRHRPGAAPHRATRRLVPAHPARHRRRARARPHARDHRRGPRRRGVRPRPHRRLRRAGRARAAVHAGVGGAGDGDPGRRHPHARPRVRHEPTVDDPDRGRDRAARGRRADRAGDRLPARAGRGVAQRRRRPAATAAVGVPGQLGRRSCTRSSPPRAPGSSTSSCSAGR